MKKRIVLILSLAMVLASGSVAQNTPKHGKPNKHEIVRDNDRPRFKPEEFKCKMESFIRQHADLDKKECEVFFPLFHEMHAKLREVHKEMRTLKKSIDKASTDKQAAKALSQLIVLKEKEIRIQETYYKKMCAQMSACKVMTAIKAEDKFHREMFRRNSVQRPYTKNGNHHGKQKK